MAGGVTTLSTAHRLYRPADPGSTKVSSDPDTAPSMDLAGNGLMDPRLAPGQANGGNSNVGVSIVGWYGTHPATTINAVPYTATANNIATTQHITSGTPMTLVSTSGTGVTITAAAAVIVPSLNTVPAGSLVLDGAPATVNFGLGYVTAFYSPSTILSRCIKITASATVTATFTIRGADIYGYPMTQTLTISAGTSATTLKAFKYVYSVTPATTDGTNNYTVGTTDTIGLPLSATRFEDTMIWNNGTLITANTGFTGADTTSPATAATGDVRGTYTLQTASNNSNRIVFRQFPGTAGQQTSFITGLTGVTQF